MSLCRWSTNDYQCHLYVYESHAGFVVHVAGNRVVYHQELPEPVSLADDPVGWVKRHRIIMDWLEDDTKHHREFIGLPHDGETFDAIETPGETADILAMLRDEGYLFPVQIIDELRAEQAKVGPEF